MFILSVTFCLSRDVVRWPACSGGETCMEGHEGGRNVVHRPVCSGGEEMKLQIRPLKHVCSSLRFGRLSVTLQVWKDTEEAEMWYTGLCALVERNRRPKSERLGLSHRRSASMTLDELREWSPDMSPFRQRVEVGFRQGHCFSFNHLFPVPQPLFILLIPLRTLALSFSSSIPSFLNPPPTSTFVPSALPPSPIPQSSPPVEPNESSSQADYRSSPESRGTGRGEAMGMDTLTGAEAGAAAGAGTSIGAGTGMNFSRSAHDMSSLHEGILGRSSLFPGSTNTVAGGTSASGSARTFPGSCSTNQPCSEAGTDVSDLDDFSDTLSIGGVSVQSLPPSTTITTTVTTTATTNSPSIPSSTSATATIATAGNTSAAANASNSSTPASANFPYAAAPPPSHSAVIPTSRSADRAELLPGLTVKSFYSGSSDGSGYLPSATSSSTGDDGSEVLGDLFMWGEGLGDGALGGGGLRKRGTSSAIPIPGFDSVVPKPLDAGVVLDVCHVACGEGHAALVTRRGEVFCWGEEGGGRLGQGRERDLEHPKLVEGLDGIPMDEGHEKGLEHPKLVEGLDGSSTDEVGAWCELVLAAIRLPVLHTPSSSVLPHPPPSPSSHHPPPILPLYSPHPPPILPQSSPHSFPILPPSSPHPPPILTPSLTIHPPSSSHHIPILPHPLPILPPSSSHPPPILLPSYPPPPRSPVAVSSHSLSPEQGRRFSGGTAARAGAFWGRASCSRLEMGRLEPLGMETARHFPTSSSPCPPLLPSLRSSARFSHHYHPPPVPPIPILLPNASLSFPPPPPQTPHCSIVSSPKEVESLGGMRVSRVACSVWHTAAVVHAPTTASTLPSTASSGVTTASDGEATSSVVTSEGTSAAAGAAVAAEGAGAGAEGAVGVGAAGAGGLAGVGSAGGVTAGGVAGPFEGGRLYTWGDGDRYKLGHGNKQQQLLPKAVDALSQVDISQVEQIACGTHHTAALTAASDLFTWGRGSHGQLGHGDVRDRELPTRVEAIKDQRVLSVSQEGVEGGAWRVGHGGWGVEGGAWRLGHGDVRDREVPTRVEAIKDQRVLPVSFLWASQRVSIGMLRAQTTTTAQYPFLSWILSLYSLFQSSPSPQVSCGPASTAVVCQHRHAQGSDHHHCTLCRQAFSFARIRHHCYNCSLPVCHACSPRKLLGAAMAPTPTRPYRVCDMCFNKISKVSAGSSGSTSNSSSSGKMSKGSNSISTSSSINLKSSSSTGSSSSSSSSSISSSGSLGGMGSGGGGGAGGGGKPGLFTTSSSGGSAAGGNRGSSAGSGGAAATAAGGNFLSLSSNSASSGSSIGPGAAGMRSSTSRAKAGSFTGTPGLSPGQSPGNATETQHVHARSHDGGSALPLPMWGPVSPPPLFASLVSRQAFAPMAYPHYPHTETQQQQQQQQQQHSQQQQQQHQAGQQASLRKSPSPQPHHAIPSSSTSVSSSLPILPSGFLSHASSSSSSSSSSSPSSTTSWLFSQTSASLSTSIASPTPSSSLAPNSATATTPPTLPSRHSSYSLSPNLPDDSGPPPRASRTISLRGSVAGLVIGSGRRPSSPLMWQSSNSPLGAGRAASPTGAQVAAAAAAAAAAMIAGSSAAGGGVGRVAASGGFPVIGGVGVEPWDWRQQGGAVGSGEARWRKAKEEADKEIQRLREELRAVKARSAEVERERQAERRLASKQVEAAFSAASRAAARAAGARDVIQLLSQQ
ncbi:unnamed protein product, partial [Closterium sp. NIES-53]